MALHFIRPLWFLALIPLLILIMSFRHYQGKNTWQAVCDGHLLSALMGEEKTTSHLHFLLLIGTGWLIAIVALAGPSFAKQYQQIYHSSTAQVIVLSLSPSMYEKDNSTPKIDRARFKIFDLLQRQKDGSTGLVVYTSQPFVVTPLTEDNNTIANLVPLLEPGLMPVNGNQIAPALNEAKKLLEQASANEGDIILISDSIDDFSESQHAADSLNKAGFTLHVLDVNSKKISSKFKALAKQGGGEAIGISSTNDDINLLLRKLNRNHSVNTQKNSTFAMLWRDEGRVVAILLIPFMLLLFRRGIL